MRALCHVQPTRGIGRYNQSWNKLSRTTLVMESELLQGEKALCQKCILSFRVESFLLALACSE
jgi:hypothetical protein